METNKPIKLEEYSTKIPSIESKDIGHNAKVDERLVNLKLTIDDKKLLEGPLSNVLKIIKLEDGLSITSNSHIGIAKFSNFTVVVEPKILINPKNLFGMISYIFNIEEWERLPDAPFYFQKPESYLIEIIILLFVEECKRLLKKGLYKSYVTYQDNISYLRGKLLLIQNTYNVLKNKPKFACEYDELEYDNVENQIILFCLQRSYKITKSQIRKNEIRKLLFQFSDYVSTMNISMSDFKKFHYTRFNNHYQNIHNLCKIIIDSAGVTDFYAETRHIISSFFVDMNEIFEKFIFKLFDEFYLPTQYRAIEQKKRWAWKIDLKTKKSIRTDILLENRKDPKNVIVIDTKYKDRLYESDLYQIGFYIHEYVEKTFEGQKTGYAILPKSYIDGKPLQDHTISSSHQGIQIIQKHIDLDNIVPLLQHKQKNKKEIENCLNKLLEVNI